MKHKFNSMKMKVVRFFGGLLAACCVGLGMTGCGEDAKEKTAVAVTLKCSEDMLDLVTPTITVSAAGEGEQSFRLTKGDFKDGNTIMMAGGGGNASSSVTIETVEKQAVKELAWDKFPERIEVRMSYAMNPDADWTKEYYAIGQSFGAIVSTSYEKGNDVSQTTYMNASVPPLGGVVLNKDMCALEIRNFMENPPYRVFRIGDRGEVSQE